jgi:transcriptional regulator with XRE-family HTH domain
VLPAKIRPPLSELTMPSQNPIDLHVGNRLRLRRKYLGLSQVELARSVALTFQQIQKYERGSNRVSASKLYEMGRFLGVNVSYFFDCLDLPESGQSEAELTMKRRNAFLATPEGVELVDHYSRIRSERVRRKIRELVGALSSEGSGET